ncbi:MAG TPA: hypothetical protein VND95_17490 [Stellaceae bacterium]|nr:hypothetical protein [Stellaceae bacterium]
MRRSRPAFGRRLIVAATACGIAAPALAGQSASRPDLSQTWLDLPPSAATGKPAVAMPPLATGQPGAGPCLPPLPCGTRLLGTIRKNGVVAVQVPALRW